MNKNTKRLMLAACGTGIVFIIGIFIIFPFFLNKDFKVSTGKDNKQDVIQADTESPLQDNVEEIEEKPKTLQIVMVGDMLMHEKVMESGKEEDGSYNFDHLFANVKGTIARADLALVNQETILGGKAFGYTGYPSFNSPYELGDAEVKAGFDVILHATNHTLDKREKGVENCMDFWDTNYPYITYLGINKSQKQQDENIYVYEKNGIKVAILNYTYGTNGIEPAEDQSYLVNYLEEDKVKQDIKKAEELADFTIICPHWGTEYKLEPDDSQKKWTEIFLTSGVDLVMGAHPHVIEPVEWVTDDAGNKMLVYYSLGNFVNGTSSSSGMLAHRMVGGIADVTLGIDEKGEVSVVSNDIIPIVCHIDEGTEYTVYYLDEYTSEMAEENLIRKQDPDFSLDQCWEVVDQVWGQEER